MSTSRAPVPPENSTQTGRITPQKPHCYDELSALRTDLIQKVSATVSPHKLTPAACGELSEVVQAYHASLQNLRTIHEDAGTFVEALCRRHYVTDDEHLDTVRRTKSSATIVRDAGKDPDFLSLDPIRVSINLEPELFALSVAEGARQLQEDLRQNAEGFVDNLLDVMDKLVELHVVGTIDWPIPTACRFRFFQTKLEVVGETEVTQNASINGKTWQRKYRQRETTYTLHGQQQHLAYARRTELPTYQRTMPIRVRELCDDVPIWLEERIDVVAGDLFRSDTVQEHLKTEIRSELLEETELVYHPDPAIVMGPFVLATWLSEDVDAERHRAQCRTQLRHQQAERQLAIAKQQSYKPLAWAASLQAVPLILQLLAVSYWPSMHWVAVALSLLLLLAMTPWIRGVAVAHGARPDASLYLVAVAAGVFTVLALQVLVVALGYLTIPLLVLCLFLVGVSLFLMRELLAILQTGN